MIFFLRVNDMRVKTEDLIEGCILSEDVYGNTNRPIIKKNTVLTNELIEILNVFLITSVEVNYTLVTGLPFHPSEILIDTNSGPHPSDETYKKEFTTLFLEATREYKRY